MSKINPPLAIPTINEIRAQLCVAAFGSPLISNIYRGLVAEIIVGATLGCEWQLCSGDWRGWDFEHTAGLRLEVKQSAARQTWTGERPQRPYSIFGRELDISRVQIGSPIPDASLISISSTIIRSWMKVPITVILANGDFTSSQPLASRLARPSAW